MKTSLAPVWKHDCKRCKFLGTVWMENKGPADWYVCGDSVLARFSDDGPDYWSSLRQIVEDDRYLLTDVAAVHDRAKFALGSMNIIARFMLKLQR
jgi:hypothetical protein